MPRLAAMLLLVLFSFSLISPAFAPDPESSLPACCRKSGAHKCAMEPRRGHESGPEMKSQRMTCPEYPAAQTAPASAKFAPATPAGTFSSSLLSYPAVHTQTQTLLRISRLRSSQKRGPPARLS